LVKPVVEDLVAGIKKQDLKSISKAISFVENNIKKNSFILSKLYPIKKNSHRIGITGPPGAGKSTITNLLIRHFRTQNKRVAVILVDPTSPYSNGAVLGDRIRMFNHYDDKDVFIRSLATRGSKGGLSKNVNEIADIFSAANFDIVLFETVGVGQVEVDVVEKVDTVVLTLVPESGDDIQMMKAGIVEIADIFVINKADRADANKLYTSIKNVLNLDNDVSNDWVPSILKTIATEDKGVKELVEELNKHHLFINEEENVLSSRINKRYASKVQEILSEKLDEKFWNDKNKEIFDFELSKNIDDRMSPYSLVDKLLEK
tara:strand:- start:1309 stop:2259 length:951 start_codon:yes stop_codon:yes gene_type:complete